MIFYPIGETEACRVAAEQLSEHGIPLTDHPSPDVTHLLLDVPSRINSSLETLLRMLPPQVHIIGGNLGAAGLEKHRHTDLLTDPFYLAENAAITADCALRLAGSHMDMTFSGCPALVIGWGRIGKCLAKKLRALGCDVSVAARNVSDRAMLQSLGYRAVPIDAIAQELQPGTLVFNTVPHPLPDAVIPDGCIALELASTPGLSGGNIIDGRRLPGRLAPKSSGKLISKTILRRFQEEAL